jgi:hypothetical protein
MISEGQEDNLLVRIVSYAYICYNRFVYITSPALGASFAGLVISA